MDHLDHPDDNYTLDCWMERKNILNVHTTFKQFVEYTFNGHASLDRKVLTTQVRLSAFIVTQNYFSAVRHHLNSFFPKVITIMVVDFIRWNLPENWDAIIDVLVMWKREKRLRFSDMMGWHPDQNIPVISVLREWTQLYKYARENATYIFKPDSSISFCYQKEIPVSSHFFWVQVNGDSEKMYINNLYIAIQKTETLEFSPFLNCNLPHDELEDALNAWVQKIGSAFFLTGDFDLLRGCHDWFLWDWLKREFTKEHSAIRNTFSV